MMIQSIKISTRTKEKIEKTQAELLLNRNEKVNQSELLEKIVEKATADDNFMESLFPSNPSPPVPAKKSVNVQIVARRKPGIRLFPEEWED